MREVYYTENKRLHGIIYTLQLAPLLDNYYDLVRYGADVFVEQVRVKEPARRLLSSDIPLLHQELLDVQEAQLIADAL
ncbi:hypothetical protein [Methylomicrobium album]|uniref:hypothetical protein n=1 Tax=Methylomicrobium album TaxID=39775 RepID=UPI0002623F8E|nr:hypothetical protein [Methylomicrobium album]